MSLARGGRFTGRVRDLGSNGHGVVEHDSGRVVFVPGVWSGETVTVRVTELKSQYARGELLAVVDPSPDRVAPACKHHGQGAGHCGGCPWQFVRYEAQLAAKQQRAASALVRLGIPDEILQPIIGSERVLGYRNRAQFKSDGRWLGYVGAGSRSLVDVQDCPVLTPRNREAFARLRRRLPENAWRPRRRGDWTTIDIDEQLGDSIGRRLPFRQVNDGQNLRMRDWLHGRLAPLPRSRKVLELFAGSGNFTAVIAALGFTQVVAVEAVSESVRALAALHLPGVETVTANLYADDTWPRLLRAHGDARVLLLDPPREGLGSAAELFMPASGFLDVLYISCDLPTFARDCQAILAAGYEPLEIQPMDLAPQTPHLELLAHFRRC